MSNAFTFNFYGLRCRSTSNLKQFTDLLELKFKQFRPGKTHLLLSEAITITFSKSGAQATVAGTHLSSTVISSPTTIQFRHRYLLTSSYVTIIFNKHHLQSIVITYQPSILFSLLNMLLRNQLQIQLFQQLIKLYVEQTLFWYVMSRKNLQCLHAAAIEKNGQVKIFTGLNGVGKSTLAQQLIKYRQYHFFADNYMLIDKKNAYFCPDAVRLDKTSQQLIGQQSSARYGFGKFVITNTHNSRLTKAKIAQIYFVTQGPMWQKTKLSAKQFWQRMVLLLSIHGEYLPLAPVAQIASKVIPWVLPNPTISYYNLVIGTDQVHSKPTNETNYIGPFW